MAGHKGIQYRDDLRWPGQWWEDMVGRDREVWSGRDTRERVMYWWQAKMAYVCWVWMKCVLRHRITDSVNGVWWVWREHHRGCFWSIKKDLSLKGFFPKCCQTQITIWACRWQKQALKVDVLWRCAISCSWFCDLRLRRSCSILEQFQKVLFPLLRHKTVVNRVLVK